MDALRDYEFQLGVEVRQGHAGRYDDAQASTRPHSIGPGEERTAPELRWRLPSGS